MTPNIDRLRELGVRATEHFDRTQYRHKHPPCSTFRTWSLSFSISPVLVPRTDLLNKTSAKPWHGWEAEQPKDGADFYFYRKLLKFFETDLNHWVGQDTGRIGHDSARNHAVAHGAAHRSSRLRWEFRIVPAGWIEMKCWQDGLMGPGRTNGSRHSIETHHPEALAPREQLWWRYLTWRLTRWLLEQGFRDDSDPQFSDPLENIEWRVRHTGHYGGEDHIFEPRKRVTNQGRDDRDRNREQLNNGDTRYLVKDGRLVRGQVFYSLNNMWIVVVGGRLWWAANFDLFDWNPKLHGVRRFFRDSDRVERMKRVQAKMIQEEKFERAAALRDQIRKYLPKEKRA